MMYIIPAQDFPPGTDNNIRARLWEGQWYRRVFPSGDDVRGDGALPREEIIQILENVDNFLVRLVEIIPNFDSRNLLLKCSVLQEPVPRRGG